MADGVLSDAVVAWIEALTPVTATRILDQDPNVRDLRFLIALFHLGTPEGLARDVDRLIETETVVAALLSAAAGLLTGGDTSERGCDARMWWSITKRFSPSVFADDIDRRVDAGVRDDWALSQALDDALTVPEADFELAVRWLSQFPAELEPAHVIAIDAQQVGLWMSWVCLAGHAPIVGAGVSETVRWMPQNSWLRNQAGMAALVRWIRVVDALTPAELAAATTFIDQDGMAPSRAVEAARLLSC